MDKGFNHLVTMVAEWTHRTSCASHAGFTGKRVVQAEENQVAVPGGDGMKLQEGTSSSGTACCARQRSRQRLALQLGSEPEG